VIELRRFRLGTAISLGGVVAAAPLIAACGGPSYDDWAATDGAAGRINLDDVQQAFKDSKSATDFEERVNQIYEGDGLVLVRARQDGSALTLEGWEDLNNNSGVDDETDDLLFSIVKGSNDEYDMRGYHGNGYYNSHFGAGDFLFTYLLISAISPRGYYYSTPVSRGDTIRNQRTTYRQSQGYRQQVQRNSSYNTKQASFAGSRYQQSKSNVSSNRTSYQQTQRTSGTFKTSNSVSRGGSGAFRSSGGSGGFGGGGAMVVRGRRRF
jgi:hypothetical protein